MQSAGLEGQQVVLLLEDYQFIHSSFLEMINSLLSSGMIFVFKWIFFYSSFRKMFLIECILLKIQNVKCSKFVFLIIFSVGYSCCPQTDV